MPRGSAPGEHRGGRVRGTPNKATVERELMLEEAQRAALASLTPEQIEGLKPQDVMLLAMRTAVRAGALFLASTIAKEIAPYMHPRLSSATLQVKDDDAARTDDDLRREMAEIEPRMSMVH